jgi:large subunit ribosomal protein L17
MRHGIAGNKLSRNQSLRKATLRDLAIATLKKQRIQTTRAKAKEARKLVDRLITLGKKGTLADKRRAFSILCDHKLVSHLFNHMAPKFKDRNGGYTRVIGMMNRRGDNAQMALLELTERDEITVVKPKAKALKVKEEAPETEESVAKAKEVRPKSAPDVPEANLKHKPKGNVASGIKKMFNRKTATEK